jgi:hypothetical protein
MRQILYYIALILLLPLVVIEPVATELRRGWISLRIWRMIKRHFRIWLDAWKR